MTMDLRTIYQHRNSYYINPNFEPDSTNSVTFQQQQKNGGENDPKNSGSGDQNVVELEVRVQGDRLLYNINQVPPWYLCMFLGFQHFVTMMSGTALMPMIFYTAACVTNLADQAAITSSTFFVMGISTFLQATLGTRLPIIQGASAAFVAPMFTILSTSHLPSCIVPTASLNKTGSNLNFSTTATTTLGSSAYPDPNEEVWKLRLSYMGGTLAVSSLFQMFIGATGVVALIMRYVGPVVVGPTICLIGMALIQPAYENAAKQWYIALMATCILIACSYLLDRVHVPCLTIKRKRIKVTKVLLFKSFPVLIAILLSWLVCGILTATNILSPDPNVWGYEARTDVRASAIHSAAWIRVPYPGQFGLPRIAVSGILGMIAGICVSVIESIGDYLAAARLSDAPVPPTFALNRGIFLEGFGCMLAGLFSIPAGTTSYSENVGAIAITRVGCRRVVQYSALFMIILGMCPKIGAFFVSLPEPVVGGLFLALFAMVTGVGLSNLQFVNLNLPRNIFIVGFSIFVGSTIPFWLKNTGAHIAILNKMDDGAGKLIAETGFSILRTELFIGGMLAFILDNIIPASREDRGMNWNVVSEEEGSKSAQLETYDLPFAKRFCGSKRYLRFIPFCPDYSSYEEQNQNAEALS